jgi:hypothetical protein
MRGNEKLKKKIANELAEEFARKIYFKSLMLKFLPEVKAIEKGKLKALKGRKIEKFVETKLCLTLQKSGGVKACGGGVNGISKLG